MKKAMTILTDISEQKQAEMELRATLQKPQDVIEFLPDATFVIDDQKRVIAWNRALEEMTGVNKEAILGKGDYAYAIPFYGRPRPLLIDLINTEKSSIEQDYKYVQRKGNTLFGEGYIPSLLGRETHLWGTASPLFDQTGRFIGAIESIRDVTCYKQTEEALRQSEERWQLALRGSNDGIWDWNIKTGAVFLSPRWKEIRGHKQHEGSNHWDEWAKQTHPDDIDRVTQAIQEHLAGKTPFYSTEYRVLCKNRTYKWVHDRGQALWDEEGNPVRMVGSYTDITARKRAEEAWREQQEWFRVTLASIGDAVIATDTTGAVIFVNPVAAKITGFTEEEALGQPIDEVFQIINEETRLPAEIPVNRVLQDGTVVGLANHTVLVSRNGTEYPIADSAAPIQNDRGEVFGVVMVFQNVTEHRKSEEALRESEAHLRRITDNMLDMIAETDHRLVFQYVSPSNKNTLGYGPEAMLGKSIHYFLHPDDFNRVDAAIKAAVEKKSSGRIEFRYRHADGHYLWIETVGTFQFDHNGLLAGAVFCSRDVTERKKMEEELKYFSLHDPLTRLYNRTFFEEEMRRLGDGRCTSIGLIVCDLDGLKFVNDTLGHESGDSLIEVAAEIIKQCVRVSDMVARIGGDEFAILLPNNDSESVEAACNRIRKAMKQYNVANPELPLSISIGYATRTGIPKDMRELFREADNNMYREKLSRSRSTRSAIVQVLKKAMEARDFITEGHAERLQDMAAGLAETIGLSSRRIADLRLLAQFHDIGKVGVPDHILFKQGPLTIEETREIRRHCEIGQRIALTAPELIPIADWILKHHEWWDGQGYPMGLKGERIPLECRILAIVDAYDAMTSDRPYRKAMSPQKAITELYRYMGIQFDPQLVPKFVQILNLNA